MKKDEPEIRPIVNPPGRGLKITRSRPEDAPERLAIRTAELLVGIRNKNADAQAYTTQAQAEKQKAANLSVVILELQERKRNPPEVVSRMDPYATYDLEMCKEEHASYVARALMLQSLATKARDEVGEYERELLSVRAKLIAARKPTVH